MSPKMGSAEFAGVCRRPGFRRANASRAKFGWPDGEILETITLLMKKHFDPWSLIVIILTLVLFAVALMKKGFTHDLLLEAGVFLVSAKLVLMSYKLSVTMVNLQQQVEEILDALRKRDKPVAGDAKC
jgi:hypothetical protein